MENNVETEFVSYSAHCMMKMGLGLYGCVRRTQIHSQLFLGCRLGLGLLAVGVFFSLLGPLRALIHALKEPLVHPLKSACNLSIWCNLSGCQ